MVQQEKHRWREQRIQTMAREAEETRHKRENVQASVRGAKGNKQAARDERIELNRVRMRREIGKNRRMVEDSAWLIGQYAEIERNLMDFVQDAELQHELKEAELHEYICTAPSTRVDLPGRILRGRRR